MFHFFIFYLAAWCPTLGHYQGASLTHPMLLTVLLSVLDLKVTSGKACRDRCTHIFLTNIVVSINKYNKLKINFISKKIHSNWQGQLNHIEQKEYLIVKITTGKQYLQRKLNNRQKVWIPKFSNFMYKNQYFSKTLMNLIGF